jgi:pilus assembly protein CpaB
MSRTQRTFLVLGLALVVASVASFGVYRAVQQIPVRQVEVPGASVVVAARSLPQGQMITAQDLKVVNWPAREPLAGGFSNLEAVTNRGLVASVVENEPILESKLAPIGTGAGLPPTIPEGMRAISVKVDEVIGVAGFVVPGTRVDVVVTARGSRTEESMSRVVVSDVKVLTAGTRYDQEKSRADGQPIAASVVTLVATPEDAERIALASVEGKITLTLRNPLDTRPSQTRGVRMAALMEGGTPPPPVQKNIGGHKVVVQPPPPPPPPAPKPYTVEAIRAAKRTEEPVR